MSVGILLSGLSQHDGHLDNAPMLNLHPLRKEFHIADRIGRLNLSVMTLVTDVKGDRGT